MEQSILTSTKKILGLDQNYTHFDLDICTHINAALATLDDLGVGPAGGFVVEDETTQWAALLLDVHQLNRVKNYIYLKVRYVWDPPTTSYAITAMKEQIAEAEWRICSVRDLANPIVEVDS